MEPKNENDHFWRRRGGYAEVLRVSFPLILSTSAWTLQQFVDRMFLSWYSPAAIAASMPAGILNFTLISLFFGTVSYVTTFVAQLVGTPRINLLPAVRNDGMLHVKDSSLKLSNPAGMTLPAEFLLGIRPEDVKPDGSGEFVGRLGLTEPLGAETILHIRSGEQTLLSIVPGIAPFRIGDEVRFMIQRDRLHFFDQMGVRLQD